MTDMMDTSQTRRLRWTHADGVADHPIDPHYNGNGRPAFWTCHVKVNKATCDRELRLDGGKVPMTVPVPAKVRA